MKSRACALGCRRGARRWRSICRRRRRTLSTRGMPPRGRSSGSCERSRHDMTPLAFATRAYSWAASSTDMSCTRCGLCLESCPTYTLWGGEADSPRGRIVLIEDALGPGGRATPEMAVHIDRCLGCMACMSVCPEDVPFTDLLAAGRTAIEHEVVRPTPERLRRRAALAALPRAGRISATARRGAIPLYTPAQGGARGRVGLLLGCTQRAVH